MRYELDNDGYILNVFFGCHSGSCTEYTGEVPEGYDTLPIWAENANIRAYKLVDGNLVLDTVRNAELERIYASEQEEGSYASVKYVNDKLSSVNTICDDELSNSIEGSSLILIEDTKEIDIVEMLVKPNKEITGDIKIKVTNENILGNKAFNKEENGLTFEVQEDRSITINGTATADTEYVLNSSLENTETLFFLKANNNYMQCGLPSGVKINLYSYDGTDRSLISSTGNDTINLSSTAYITYVTLNISKGSTFKNTTVYPMIKIGTYSNSTTYEYIPCKENELLTISLQGYNFINNDTISISRDFCTFTKNICLYPSDNLYPSDDLYPIDYNIELYEIIKAQKSFKDKTLIQCDKDVSINVKYFSEGYLDEKFAEIKVREDEIKLEVSDKFKNYSTTDEMNSAISVKADEITSTVSKTYTTKNENNNTLDTAKGYTDTQVTTAKSEIKQTTDYITSEVSKKVGNNEIISKINQTAESITIDANKLNINGTVSANGNFKVDTAGNMTCSNAKITGGKIDLSDTQGNPILSIKSQSGYYSGYISSNGANFYGEEPGTNGYVSIDCGFVGPGGSIYLAPSSDEWQSNSTTITNGEIDTLTVNQRSLESIKKNINKFEKNAIEIIKNSEIYEYNFRDEKDEDKKHIGFVIADNGGNYETPNEVLSINGDAIDAYNMRSIMWKAIQEQQETIEQLQKQQEIIEQLQKEIKELKEVK